jgi:integrase
MGEIRKRGSVYWIRFYDHTGKRHEESTRSQKRKVAVDLLRRREGAVAGGEPITAKIGRFTFDQAAADLLAEYQINRRASIDEAERRIRLHLMPFFGGRKMAGITPGDIRAYVVHRQQVGTVNRHSKRRADVSDAEINRELALVKRMFRLAVQAEKLIRAPHIALLEERNTRTGFLEPEQLAAVIRHLPEPLRPVIAFASITGWRIDSEVLPLQWHQVDFAAGEVRLNPETTKNRAGRTFPLTDDLRTLLDAQYAEHQRLKQAGQICPFVFFRLIAKGRGGTKYPKPITRFTKAWKNATRAAGCPGRIPHDLRRTAVRTMVRLGVPERVAMTLTGHRTRSVFERYNIVSSGDLQTARMQLSGQFPSARKDGTDE